MRSRLLVALILIPLFATGQLIYTPEFARRLMDKSRYEFAGWVIDKLSADTFAADEINYLRGLNYYKQQNFEHSVIALLDIDSNSTFYNVSRLVLVVDYGYMNNLSLLQLAAEEINDTAFYDAKNFALMGAAIMRNDFESYTTFRQQVNGLNHLFQNPVQIMDELAVVKMTRKQKSPLLAGLMSGIIPGSGKMYAGNYGSGIAAFASTVSLAAMTWENYRKDGVTDPKTILFGTLFSVFYVGNIWGSVVNINVQNQVINDGINRQILVEMHIPLRTLFK